MNVVLIRYNTQSQFAQDRWRLIINGEEKTCGKIEIRVPAYTSSDFISEEVGIKHHIVCFPESIIFQDETAILMNDIQLNEPGQKYKDEAMETAIFLASQQKNPPNQLHKLIRLIYEKKVELGTEFTIKDANKISKYLLTKKD